MEQVNYFLVSQGISQGIKITNLNGIINYKEEQA